MSRIFGTGLVLRYNYIATYLCMVEVNELCSNEWTILPLYHVAEMHDYRDAIV